MCGEDIWVNDSRYDVVAVHFAVEKEYTWLIQGNFDAYRTFSLTTVYRLTRNVVIKTHNFNAAKDDPDATIASADRDVADDVDGASGSDRAGNGRESDP